MATGVKWVGARSGGWGFGKPWGQMHRCFLLIHLHCLLSNARQCLKPWVEMWSCFQRCIVHLLAESFIHSPDNAQDLEDSIIANRRTLDDRCALLQEVRARGGRGRVVWNHVRDVGGVEGEERVGCGCGSTQQVYVGSGLGHVHPPPHIIKHALCVSPCNFSLSTLSAAPILHASAPACHPCTRCCSSNSIDKILGFGSMGMVCLPSSCVPMTTLATPTPPATRRSASTRSLVSAAWAWSTLRGCGITGWW